MKDPSPMKRSDNHATGEELDAMTQQVAESIGPSTAFWWHERTKQKRKDAAIAEEKANLEQWRLARPRP